MAWPKARIVAADEKEAGQRALLNLGHTFGHAIERCQGYGEWLHGEAVAAGMVMAARLSGIGEGDVARLRSLIAAAGLPVEPPAIAAADWMAAMGMDKKVQDRKLRFVLLDAIGSSRVTADYDARRLDGLVADAA